MVASLARGELGPLLFNMISCGCGLLNGFGLSLFSPLSNPKSKEDGEGRGGRKGGSKLKAVVFMFQVQIEDACGQAEFQCHYT
jgi:hypothetical protein